MSGGSFAQLIDRLERWLVQHRPAYFARYGPGACEAELDDLEQLIGRPLTAEFRLLYRWRNGGDPEADEPGLMYGFEPISLAEIADEWRLQLRLLIARHADRSEEGAWDLWWHAAWIPFLRYIPNGQDLIVVDSEGAWNGRSGQLVEYLNKQRYRCVMFPDLHSWLRSLVETLEQGIREQDPDQRFHVPGHDLESHVAQHVPGHPIQRQAELIEDAMGLAEELLEAHWGDDVWSGTWDIERTRSFDELAHAALDANVNRSAIPPIVHHAEAEPDQLLEEITRLYAGQRLSCRSTSSTSVPPRFMVIERSPQHTLSGWLAQAATHQEARCDNPR